MGVAPKFCLPPLDPPPYQLIMTAPIVRTSIAGHAFVFMFAKYFLQLSKVIYLYLHAFPKNITIDLTTLYSQNICDIFRPVQGVLQGNIWNA